MIAILTLVGFTDKYLDCKCPHLKHNNRLIMDSRSVKISNTPKGRQWQ